MLGRQSDDLPLLEDAQAASTTAAAQAATGLLIVEFFTRVLL